MNAPCKGCVRDFKSIGCHASCPDYIAYRNAMFEEKEQMKKKSRASGEVLSYLRADKEKRRKRGI